MTVVFIGFCCVALVLLSFEQPLLLSIIAAPLWLGGCASGLSISNFVTVESPLCPPPNGRVGNFTGKR